jgi:hypothetical protein
MSQTKTVPATFRYVAFHDLLADASSTYVGLKRRRFIRNERYARASIIASALSLECVANCLRGSVDAPVLREEIDKLAPVPTVRAVVTDAGRKAAFVGFGLSNLLGAKHLTNLVGRDVMQRHYCRRGKVEPIYQWLQNGS